MLKPCLKYSGMLPSRSMIGCLESVVVGTFVPHRSAETTDQGFLLPEQSENHQHPGFPSVSGPAHDENWAKTDSD